MPEKSGRRGETIRGVRPPRPGSTEVPVPVADRRLLTADFAQGVMGFDPVEVDEKTR